MNSRLPSIGLVTTMTNSFSRGYLAYLASIDSWSKWMDQIVIVDGGTTDPSYTILKHWIDKHNWGIFYSPQTLWGKNRRWHCAQMVININAGLERLSTDWAFVINSDYVLDLTTTKGMRKILADNQDSYCATFKRIKLNRDGIFYSGGYPGFALNLRKLRWDGVKVGFGISQSRNNPSDAPIYLSQQTQFIDPVNGEIKTISRGPWLPVNLKLEMRCFVYGHFFFDIEQAFAKLFEFNQIYQVRYARKAIKNRQMFIFEEGICTEGILSKERELHKPHPEEVKRVIAEFYRPEMLGNTNYRRGPLTPYIRHSNLLRRKTQEIVFLLRSFPCVRDAQEWSSTDDETLPPLNLKKIYKSQDRFLPPSVRIF